MKISTVEFIHAIRLGEGMPGSHTYVSANEQVAITLEAPCVVLRTTKGGVLHVPLANVRCFKPAAPEKPSKKSEKDEA